MIEVLLNAIMAVTLIAPAQPRPVEYTATNPAGVELVYHPERGWVGRDACPWGCYVQADVPVQLLSGELDVRTLADLQVSVRRDGISMVDFFHLFGAGPGYFINR